MVDSIHMATYASDTSFVILPISNFDFVATYFNLAQLHKPIEEQDNKVKTLRRKLNIGWFFMLLVVTIFFGTFTAGFWLVYPDKVPEGSLTGHSIWPRWFTLGVSVSNVVGAVIAKHIATLGLWVDSGSKIH
ncbi:LOW QUALITY PROTEIN: hypothetical protein YC2023_053544 [Brassica napus]